MDFLRQLDLVPPEALETPVAVVGCGGIGSFAALALANTWAIDSVRIATERM